ncbi:hypothetical protein ACWGI1_27995, partial [Streptomyces sp. NPDC054835]
MTTPSHPVPGPVPGSGPEAAPPSATALARLARMDIAFLNWRDPWHPDAGGAEAYAHEIARRFSAAGAHVTFVSSRY